MRCTSVQSDLPDYLSGALPEARARSVAAHLAACATCSGIADEIRPVFSLLETDRQAPRPPVTDPSFIVSVNARIDAPRARVFHAGPVFKRLIVPTVAGACAVAVLLIFAPVLQRSDEAAFSPEELTSIIHTLDDAQRSALRDDLRESAAAPAQDALAELAPDAATLDDDALTGTLFAGVEFTDLLHAGSDYLSTDDLLDLVPADAVDATAQDRPSPSVQ